MSTDSILLTRDGTIATVTLNNPDGLNALNKAMWQRLGEIMRELSADKNLRCVVLRGAGDRAFSAGADISEFASQCADSAQARVYGELIHETMRAIAGSVHPTVAMIRGACVGGGLEIAAMCDMRICGESSRFGVPVNRLGLTMAYGELQGLLSLAGPAATLEILLEGRVFDAAEALQKKLINRVVRDDRVEAETLATASRIAAGAPLVARLHKQYIDRLSVKAALSQAEWDEGFACFDTEDYKIGVAAFLGKFEPRFGGS